MAIKHKTYLKIATLIAENSKAKRKKVGAILVKDDNIIAIGYNGTPSGFNNNCEDKYTNTKKEVLHAESNAISKCSKNNISSKNSILYCTLSPCFECAKLIIQAGIKKVYISTIHSKSEGLFLLKKANIKIIFKEI